MKLILVMGVCGCGKSIVGRSLAEKLGAKFLDADDFHPPANVAKMQSGQPLTDSDRHEWLANLVAAIRTQSKAHQRVVLACSALKQSYRETLRGAGFPMTTIYLQLTPAIAAARVAARQSHFMPPTLVASQFATLEEPANAITINAGLPFETVLAACEAQCHQQS